MAVSENRADESNTDAKEKIIRGKPKSGRVWKRQGTRKSSIINVKSLHKTWSKRQLERTEKKSIKSRENEMKASVMQVRQQKRERTLENRKRREENARKAEVVQNITDSSKIKRMKKKQLRKIETR